MTSTSKLPWSEMFYWSRQSGEKVIEAELFTRGISKRHILTTAIIYNNYQQIVLYSLIFICWNKTLISVQNHINIETSHESPAHAHTHTHTFINAYTIISYQIQKLLLNITLNVISSEHMDTQRHILNIHI